MVWWLDTSAIPPMPAPTAIAGSISAPITYPRCSPDSEFGAELNRDGNQVWLPIASRQGAGLRRSSVLARRPWPPAGAGAHRSQPGPSSPLGFGRPARGLVVEQPSVEPDSSKGPTASGAAWSSAPPPSGDANGGRHVDVRGPWDLAAATCPRPHWHGPFETGKRYDSPAPAPTGSRRPP